MGKGVEAGGTSSCMLVSRGEEVVADPGGGRGNTKEGERARGKGGEVQGEAGWDALLFLWAAKGWTARSEGMEEEYIGEGDTTGEKEIPHDSAEARGEGARNEEDGTLSGSFPFPLHSLSTLSLSHRPLAFSRVASRGRLQLFATAREEVESSFEGKEGDVGIDMEAFLDTASTPHGKVTNKE